MKFTLSWLKEHLDTDASLDQITDTLTAIGLEVEEVDNPADLFASFKVAFIEKAEKHPDADRLKVCVVDTGKEKLQVVCGAPNARAGMKGIFAPAGSYIPGLDIELKKSKIRGEESNGMMVSEKEMNLSDEHNGIIELPDDAEIGTAFADIFGLNDPVIEIALTPNRADCAGIRGIARDLAAAGLGTLKPLSDDAVKGEFASPINVHLDFDKDTEHACPVFIGRYIKGVKNGPSPDWLQKRLKAIGLRPISALVDITNYLSYALCRPLHVFDADKLNGDIHVRLSKKGEEFEALDDKTYTLDDGMTVVTDDKEIVGLGAIMGGLDSSCTEETVNVYLECAYFDPALTAKTGRALQISSDARYRFERGIDPLFTIPGAEIATKIILELCGGEPSEAVIAGQAPNNEQSFDFDIGLTEKMTGVAVAQDTQKEILETLGFEVSGTNPFKVARPSWREDIQGQADLVEEIIRIYGYDKIEAVSMPKLHAITEPAETDLIRLSRKVKTALAGRGMQECITYSFMSSELADFFGANDNQNKKALSILNPISAEMDQMRPTPLGNLIQAAGQNRDKGFANNALFEVGPAFVSTKANEQVPVACGVRSGQNADRHWKDSNAHRNVDVYDVKADAMAAIEAAGFSAQNLQVTTDAPDWYHPGQSGVFRLGANIIGYFGQIHPSILSKMGIKTNIAGFEIFLNKIPAQRNKGGTARAKLELSAFQPVSRDFAFIIADDIPAAEIIRTAKGTSKDLIERVDIFDVYKGKGVDDGHKSIAINVILQPKDKTLTDQDIEQISQKIIEAVQTKCQGKLRG